MRKFNALLKLPVGRLGTILILLAVFGITVNNTSADDKKIEIELFAPKNGDQVGINGRGWFIDLAISFPTSLQNTGFTQFQLTGPGVHNNAAPFPGSFSLGADERLPGLIVLLSTTTVGAKSCQNIANLFNLTGVTDMNAHAVEIWDTWLVGAPSFGINTPSVLFVAVAADKNGDGIYNDAPAIVPDADGNGVCNAQDLRELGSASKIKSANFIINP